MLPSHELSSSLVERYHSLDNIGGHSLYLWSYLWLPDHIYIPVTTGLGSASGTQVGEPGGACSSPRTVEGSTCSHVWQPLCGFALCSVGYRFAEGSMCTSRPCVRCAWNCLALPPALAGRCLGILGLLSGSDSISRCCGGFFFCFFFVFFCF